MNCVGTGIDELNESFFLLFSQFVHKHRDARTRYHSGPFVLLVPLEFRAQINLGETAQVKRYWSACEGFIFTASDHKTGNRQSESRGLPSFVDTVNLSVTSEKD